MESGPDKPSMYCRQCQYVLDGLPEHRCPECGTDFEPGDPKSWWPSPKEPKKFQDYWPLSFVCLFVHMTVDFGGLTMQLPVVFLGAGLALSGCRRGPMGSRIVSAMLVVIWFLVLFWLLSGLM